MGVHLGNAGLFSIRKSSNVIDNTGKLKITMIISIAREKHLTTLNIYS